MRKVAGVLGLVSLIAATTVVLAAPAGAQTSYPPTACTLELAGGEIATAGGTLAVFGSGFVPGATVPLTVNGAPVGSAVASGAGTIDTVITIPANATSPVVLAAPNCQISFELGAVVVPARPRALAFTGSDTSPLVAIGIVAVALGALLLFGARRRGATRAAVEAAKVAS